LKDIVNLKKYNNITNEWRAFYINKELISLELNTEQKIDSNKPNKTFVEMVGKCVDKAVFYTIDFAELEDNTWVVLEAGDGQVSGLSPYTYELSFFSNIIKYLKQ
jgi:hypothetical protein